MKNIILTLTFIFACISIQAQKKERTKQVAAPKEDQSDQLLSKVKYRSIGPYRGGRSAAVAGSYKNRTTFYFGGTGGGVWKTTDGGSNWKNISDKYFGGTIGAVAVAPSDESIVYAGEGEIEIDNSAALKEVTANKLKITNSATVTYESGLANNNFFSGPSGSWTVQSWGETQ